MQFDFISIAANVDNRYCQYHQPSRFRSTNDTLSTINHILEDDKEESLDKSALIEYVNQDGHYDDTLCNVFRSGIDNKSKISTYGFWQRF